MIAGAQVKIGVLSSAVMVILVFIMILPVVSLHIYGQGFPSTSNAETTKERLVVRNPEYHGTVFANQISLSTDKQFYKKGETINFTIANLGIRPVHFSVANSNLEIKNTMTNETYIPSTLLESSTIPSGGSKIITWNQKGFNEEQVQPGRYFGKITTGSLSSNVTFYIR